LRFVRRAATFRRNDSQRTGPPAHRAAKAEPVFR
jgi:hypothetical protein